MLLVVTHHANCHGMSPVMWLSQSFIYPLLTSKLGVLKFRYLSFAVVLCTPRYPTALGLEKKKS